MQLINDDCLNYFPKIKEKSIDLVLCDPPYGTTACKWDSIITLEAMWVHLKRVIKPNAAIVMTASQPFTTRLIASNLDMFRYCWHWHKGYSTGFANCNKMPMKAFEDVCVFYKKLPTYNPQGLKKITQIKRVRKKFGSGQVMGKNGLEMKEYFQSYKNYPIDEIRTKKEKTFHPTGKPVALMEYLIKTYSNEGETVLDFAMGSGTTGVACKNLNRNFIGIEKDKNYFNVAQKRLNNVKRR